MPDEADICRRYVVPKLQAAGCGPQFRPPMPHHFQCLAADATQTGGSVRHARGAGTAADYSDGNVMEIAQQFGGEGRIVEAVARLQTLLYAALHEVCVPRGFSIANR